jgi:hypothetical protein
VLLSICSNELLELLDLPELLDLFELLELLDLLELLSDLLLELLSRVSGFTFPSGILA